MRRFLLVAAAGLLAGCGSGGTASSSSSSSSTSSAPPRSATSASASSLTTSVTLDPAVQEAADRQGARAVVTLYAARLQRAHPAEVTQAMIDCLPDALIEAIGAHELLVLFNGTPFDALSAPARASAVGAFRGCGFGDDLLRSIGLLTP